MSRARHAAPGRPWAPRPHAARSGLAATRAERRQARRRADRRTRVVLAVLGATVGLSVASAGAAFGYWLTTDSSQPARGVAAVLPAPGAAVATESGNAAISVGWTLPGTQLGGAHYQVTRTVGPGSPAVVCTVPALAHMCRDNGLVPATGYSYSVMAILHGWQSTAVTASATTLGVTTLTLAPGVVGAPYSATLAATGGSGTYTHWFLAAGVLPSWATLHAPSGIITGTPDAAGTTTGLRVVVLDSNGFDATSVPLSITVAKADTTTAVTSNHDPSVVGQDVTYRAAVSVSAPGSGTPSGAVTFKDGSTTIACGGGSQAFNGTTATCRVTYGTTAGSPHAITAVFGGDANYSTSTSSPVAQTVGPADTTIAVTSNHDPSIAGLQVTYRATVSVSAPGSGTPAGTVTFKDGSTTIACGSGSQAFNGTTATCRVTYGDTIGSPHAITAVFGGDADYSTSTSSPLAQTVITLPGAPGGVTVVDNGCVSGLCTVTVSFTAPSVDGGALITTYHAGCTSSDGGHTPTTHSGGASPITVPPLLGAALTQGKTYTCTVTATNAAGTGPAGTSSSFTA